MLASLFLTLSRSARPEVQLSLDAVGTPGLGRALGSSTWN